MNTNRYSSLLLAAMLSASIGAATPTEARRTDFKSEHAAWVKEREAELTQPDGWTSLIGLHWVGGQQQTVGSAPGSDIRLRIGPDKLGKVEQRDGVLFFSAEAGAGVSVDGKPLQAEVPLKPEGRGGGTKLGYDGGKGQITVIDRAGKLAFRVRHADSPDRLNFKGLEVFAPDEQWQVKAAFVAHPPGKTMTIVNLIGDVNQSPNPGYVEFEKNGHTWRLEATGDPAKGLSFVFKDATSGKETYGIARFLKTGPVAADGTVVVDFNRAYNPPCAFTEYATCPLPPKENQFVSQDGTGKTVRLSVLAGEKKYAAGHATPQAPSFQVATLEGKSFDLAGHRGKWVVVNWWATWCVPCIEELPEISAFVAAHPGKVAAIGLAFEDSAKADIVGFLKKRPVSFPVAQVDPLDPPKGLPPPLGLPTTYVIAPDGRLAKSFVGPITAKELNAVIVANR